MKSDVIIIGGGASGLMAAYSAARTLIDSGSAAQVTVLEKMPRPARKIMITGKGRCNFTNIKEWNDFSGHIRSKSDFVKPAFYNLPSSKVLSFFEEFGVKTVVERGDRAFPASYHASDIVDALVNACHSVGVKMVLEKEVNRVDKSDDGFLVGCSDGEEWRCRSLVIATGGMSYPNTGSTGDGYRWASDLGHRIEPLFPSLSALVPSGYKIVSGKELHIHRDTPLASLGEKLCGVGLKNVNVSLLIDGMEADSEFGDIDFTDGGLEGPVGFQLSRKCIKAMINGSKAALSVDLKPAVGLDELSSRIRVLWQEVDRDPRSRRISDREKRRVLLGKLMPWELIPGFLLSNPDVRWGYPDAVAGVLKDWRLDIAGYVGYERAVVTAGGVCTAEVLSKTMESRLVEGLFFCGELLDCDCDTGGYNLQTAFCTGSLAGQSAARNIKTT